VVSKIFILDANVLIDYAESDLRVLSLAASHLGQVSVASHLLGEVDQIDEQDCRDLGIVVVEATMDQVAEAATGRGSLSFEDRLCLAIARDEGYSCVTNDRPLRLKCEELNVHVLWGLELMIELVRRKHLSSQAAIATAEGIHARNPQYITANIIGRFRAKVRSLSAK